MTRSFLFALPILLGPLLSFGQADPYREYAEDYCDRVAALDISTLSTGELRGALQRIAQQASVANAQAMNEARNAIRRANPEYSGTNVERDFNLRLTEALMDQCEAYLSASRALFGPCPKDNKLFALQLKEVDAIIEQYQHLPYAQQLEKVDYQLITLMFDNDQLVPPDYSNGVEDPQFLDDASVYLIHKSLSYYKLLALGGLMQMFDEAGQ